MASRRDNLSGETGLVVTMLFGAIADLRSPSPLVRARAIEWFNSQGYTDWLEAVNLPPDHLPTEVRKLRTQPNERILSGYEVYEVNDGRQIRYEMRRGRAVEMVLIPQREEYLLHRAGNRVRIWKGNSDLGWHTIQEAETLAARVLSADTGTIRWESGPG